MGAERSSPQSVLLKSELTRRATIALGESFFDKFLLKDSERREDDLSESEPGSMPS